MAADPLLVLPPELALQILFHLPLSSLPPLYRLSKNWHAFLDAHSERIYASAALREGFSGASDDVGDVVGRGRSVSEWWDGVKGWRDICKRKTMLQRAWDGDPPIALNRLIRLGRDVWRIKVDAAQKFMMTSSEHGGLTITSLRPPHRPLAFLPFVRPYAHVEYDEGFLVFDRGDASNEVWRSVADERGPGAFERVGRVVNPSLPRAYRVKYPHLAVAANSGAEIYIWDVRTLDLIRTIAVPEPVKGITYVELTPTHLLICAPPSILVFSLSTGALLARLSPTTSSVPPSSLRMLPLPRPQHPAVPIVSGAPASFEERCPIIDYGPYMHAHAMSGIGWLDWNAVHVEDGRLVAIAREGWMLVVPHFEHVLKRPENPEEWAYFIECRAVDGMLCLENGRAIVDAHGNLVMLPLFPSSLDSRTTAPYQLPDHAFALRQDGEEPASSIQACDDGLFATYIDEEGGGAEKVVRWLDFAPVLLDEEEDREMRELE